MGLRLEAMSLDVRVVLGIAGSRLRRAIRVLVDESLVAVALNVLLVLSALVPFALVLHSASFRRRVRISMNQTDLPAVIFPRFRSQRNSASSASA